MTNGNITQLLIALSSGDKSALDKLAPIVHDELRRIATYYMRRQRPGHTLQATALVNEAYIRLIDAKNVSWRDRAPFFAVAAKAMRQILIDHARKYQYAKRGGGAQKVELEAVADLAQVQSKSLLALEDALNKLATVDERKSQIVESRFFGDLTIEETAEALNISVATVQREWRIAKAWLYQEIMGDSNEP